jgi:ankyrin repeat protein
VGPRNLCSNFYLACRDSKFEEVQNLLRTMILNDVDRIEGNSSMALHTASYHGHYKIVKLLFDAGANKAIPNKYQCLRYDEAMNIPKDSYKAHLQAYKFCTSALKLQKYIEAHKNT